MIGVINLSAPRKAIQNSIDDIIFNLKMDSKGEYKYHLMKNSVSVAIMTITLVNGCPVVAYAGIADKVVGAFNPLIEVLQAVSYPICSLVEIAGAVTISFNKTKGIQMMRDGAIAFLAAQFAPALMKILVGVGAAMK